MASWLRDTFPLTSRPSLNSRIQEFNNLQKESSPKQKGVRYTNLTWLDPYINFTQGVHRLQYKRPRDNGLCWN